MDENAIDQAKAKAPPQLVKVLWWLVAITAALSLVYAILYFVGVPLRLPVVSEFRSLDLTPDGAQVVAGAVDGDVRIWDIPSAINTSVGKDYNVAEQEPWTRYTLSGPGGAVLAIGVTPDGATLIAATADGLVRAWNLADDAVAYDVNLGTGSLVAIALSADREVLAAVEADGAVHVWDAASGQEIRSFGAGAGPREAVALNDDASLVAAGDGNAIQVWNTQTGELIHTLEAYCEDGTSATEDACDEADEDWLGHTKQVSVLAFSPDGQILASGSRDTRVVFWDLETGEAAWSSEGHWATVTALNFNEAGDFVLSGGRDNAIRSLRVAGGKSTAYFVGHLSAVNALAHGPQDDTILSVGDDGTLRLWETGNQYVVHLEWSSEGLQPTWARLFAIWTLVSSILGFLALYGLRRAALWSHLLVLAMYLVGPIIVLGLPLLEVASVWWLLSAVLGIVVLRFALGRWQQRRWRALIFVLGLWLGFALVGYLLLRFLPESWQETPWLDLIFLLPGLFSPLWPPIQDLLTIPQTTVFAIKLIWSLLLLAVWYVVIFMLATRDEVATYYETPQDASLSDRIMISQRTLRTRFGVYSFAVWIALLVLLFSVLRQFNLDIGFMGYNLGFIMEGSFYTFVVSAASIVLAVVLALLGALGRMSKNPAANAISGFYISLIRGTPLLVQIYIWYLGLPRLGIVLTAIPAGILALGVNYGAYMTEIFRAGIQAIGVGQREAAQALGMSSGQTFRRIILPQAFRIVIPPIGNEFIAMMKDSSLVSIMAVRELTWRADKIGRANFRGIETFIIAAAFYWILTVIFQLFQGRLEEYMARGERR